MLTKSFFLIVNKLVDFNVWGIIQTSKLFFFTLEIVKDIPLIKIDAFCTKYFLNFFVILNSKTYQFFLL